MGMAKATSTILPCKWQDCTAAFESLDELKGHLKVHMDETYPPWFSRRLGGPQKRKRPTQKASARFECRLCGRVLHEPDAFKLHTLAHEHLPAEPGRASGSETPSPPPCRSESPSSTQVHGLRGNDLPFPEAGTLADLEAAELAEAGERKVVVKLEEEDGVVTTDEEDAKPNDLELRRAVEALDDEDPERPAKRGRYTAYEDFSDSSSDVSG